MPKIIKLTILLAIIVTKIFIPSSAYCMGMRANAIKMLMMNGEIS
jgi:hypothetical protein